VTLTVTEAPAIALSPTTLSPGCRKTTNADSQSFTVTNTGGGTLSWTVSDNVSWLSCGPTSGTLAGGAGQTVTVTYTTSGLNTGTYSATITVAGGTGVSSKTVEVTLTVTKPGKIRTSESALSVTCAPGSSPVDTSFAVENEGVGTMAYTLTEVSDWLEVAPGSGSVSTGSQSHAAAFPASSLAAGTYTGTITIASADADNSPVTIPVTLTVKVLDVGILGEGAGCSLSATGSGPGGAAGWLLTWAAALAAGLPGRGKRQRA
jgi:hypothetical protein